MRLLGQRLCGRKSAGPPFTDWGGPKVVGWFCATKDSGVRKQSEINSQSSHHPEKSREETMLIVHEPSARHKISEGERLRSVSTNENGVSTPSIVHCYLSIIQAEKPVLLGLHLVYNICAVRKLTGGFASRNNAQ